MRGCNSLVLNELMSETEVEVTKVTQENWAGGKIPQGSFVVVTRVPDKIDLDTGVSV